MLFSNMAAADALPSVEATLVRHPQSKKTGSVNWNCSCCFCWTSVSAPYLCSFAECVSFLSWWRSAVLDLVAFHGKSRDCNKWMRPPPSFSRLEHFSGDFPHFLNPSIKNHNIYYSSMFRVAWRRKEKEENEWLDRSERLERSMFVPRRREPPTYAMKCSRIWLAALSLIRPLALLLSGPKTDVLILLFVPPSAFGCT